MTRVRAGITISLDGYVAGPEDGPGRGLGEGGERLHWWVFGGPWTYDSGPRGEASGEDAAWLEEAVATAGAAVVGRWMYEAAGHWGDENPWGVPCYVVTHRPEEQPPGDAFRFVDGVEAAIEQAREAAGGKDVSIGGGADVIRQALAADLVDDLTLVVAPFTLGGGKRLFEGFDRALDLEQRGVRQSQFATFLDYSVKRG